MCLHQLRLPPKCFISFLFALINAVPVPIEAIIAFCLFEAVRPPKPIALNSSIIILKLSYIDFLTDTASLVIITFSSVPILFISHS